MNNKLLPASCEGGEVTVEGKVVTATILTQGTKASTGFVIIDGLSVYYVATNTTDLAETIDKAVEIIQDIALILTSIGAGMTGPTTAPPGTLAADVASVNTKASALLALKDDLK